jgi:hypothetical protein
MNFTPQFSQLEFELDFFSVNEFIIEKSRLLNSTTVFSYA